MNAALWLVPAFPLAGFLVLALAGRWMPRRAVAWVGVGSVGISAALSVLLSVGFARAGSGAVARTAWTWFRSAGLSVGMDFRLDALSLVFVLVVTGVGFLIHLYSVEFMRRDDGYSRFFAYMNLFVGSMLILVLADNLLLLYLGWEGVGLCSYLLIGFWYRDPANGRAARKAFIMTRVGDTAMAVGLFLLIRSFGTLAIPEVLRRAAEEWGVGSGLAVAAAALLLGGALGKSAQLPLQTWLPDAMAGPTPVSALIHAATMVTAGVYLISRMHVLFELAPAVELIVALIGAATLLVAGLSALAQSDIKRVLAYSTISQVGYMFLAMGVGAWSAAVFHFMTHAFFKALLFLAAGAVIAALDEEHDIFRMGGLRRELPLVFWTFLAGAASLSALPLVTAGFYSKGMILQAAWSRGPAGPWLWLAGTLGALITSLYAFRVAILVFWGEPKMPVSRRPGRLITVPLIVLSILALCGGFIQLPPALGRVSLLSDFLVSVFPASVGRPLPVRFELGREVLVSAAALFGVYLAYLLFSRRPRFWQRWERSRLGAPTKKFLFSGWGFDRLYGAVFVKPFAELARLNAGDVVDQLYRGVAALAASLHRLLSLSQSGALDRSLRAIVVGAILILALVVLL